MSGDLKGGDVTVPDVLVFQCANELVVYSRYELRLQSLVGFVPDN